MNRAKTEQAVLKAAERERAKIRSMFPDAPKLSWQQVVREKEAARVSDWRRIARGEVTTAEIQQENSLFTRTEVQSFRIMNLEESLLNVR